MTRPRDIVPLVATTVAALLLSTYLYKRTRRLRPPPGPHCRPFFEHAADESHMLMSASGLFAARTDTVSAAMTTFFLVMTLYPEIQSALNGRSIT
ncbi:hypothetical protein EXIGLDRAFT_759814 [Exidia glandulosa HHB12029]|uniref:Cytochrome P450 n=1 Tax=Exidia glandulosa HHB12029 TaxID=1314781 RepID=A0A166BNI8_EXIGL|nr:hypothetical protein EXIGLDRAFT_759814 [Exidia glandulosa HHB12029]